MPKKIYKVTLTKEEQEELAEIRDRGKGNARRIKRAGILLLADENREGGVWKDADIAKALGCHRTTVERTREKCVCEGVEKALNHTRPQKTRRKVLDGEAEAHLVKLACTEAPDGHECWTMQMLADELVELEVVETVSRETVRTTLKKMNLSRG
jgi:hypothetical protein